MGEGGSAQELGANVLLLGLRVGPSLFLVLGMLGWLLPIGFGRWGHFECF